MPSLGAVIRAAALAGAVMLFGADRAAASCIGLGCSCSTTATAVAFGSYYPLTGSSVNASGVIEVTCGALVLGAVIAYDIRLSSGSSGSYVSRTMVQGGHQLHYNLYTNSAHTQVWGDGSGGTGIVSDGYLLQLIYSTTRAYTVYGLIPGGQNVRFGNYTDSILVTVVY